MFKNLNPALRWSLAALASGIVCTAACWLVGYLLPTWIFGPDSPTSPTSGQIFSVTLSFACCYALLLFFLLTVVVFHGISGAGWKLNSNQPAK